MNSLEVLEALQHVSAQTRGVFPADRIPSRWSRPTAIVANTDDHTQPGTHWIAIYVDNNGHGTFFDSYGLPPLISRHRNRLRRNTTAYDWNTKPLQSIKSKVCGEYCIMFLDFMSRGYSLAAFCRIFSTNKVKNDNIVKRYYKKLKHVKRGRRSAKQARLTPLRGGGNTCTPSCIQTCTARFGCHL